MPPSFSFIQKYQSSLVLWRAIVRYPWLESWPTIANWVLAMAQPPPWCWWYCQNAMDQAEAWQGKIYVTRNANARHDAIQWAESASNFFGEWIRVIRFRHCLGHWTIISYATFTPTWERRRRQRRQRLVRPKPERPRSRQQVCDLLSGPRKSATKRMRTKSS